MRLRKTTCGFPSPLTRPRRRPGQQTSGRFGLFGREKGAEASFVRNVERIEAQQFASALHGGQNRDGRLLDVHRDAARLRQLVQRGGEPASCQVAQAMRIETGIEQGPNLRPKRRGIALYRSIEVQPVARRRDGDAMSAKIAA